LDARTHGNANRNADEDLYAIQHTNAHANRHADVHADPDVDSTSHSNRDGDPFRDRGAYALAYGHTDADAHADARATGANGYRNRARASDRYALANGIDDGNRDQHRIRSYPR
jgi:hypothetical protein